MLQLEAKSTGNPMYNLILFQITWILHGMNILCSVVSSYWLSFKAYSEIMAHIMGLKTQIAFEVNTLPGKVL